MNTKFDVGQRVTYPVVHTADGNITGIAISKAGVTSYAIGPKWYAEGDLKLTAEEKPEMGNPITEPIKESDPVKLYCIESYRPGEWLTKGKIYELDADGTIHYDDGYSKRFCDVRKNSSARRDLVPLVRRPARVGEWVLITNQHGSHTPSIQNGAIQFVIKDYGDDSVATKCENVLLEDEYLVLDGYKGESE